MKNTSLSCRQAEFDLSYRHCKTKGESPNQDYNDFCTTRGFTLIELLVVVLIIGILASIAVPQYQFAVEKARAVQAVTAVRSLMQAEERYYMANGEYTTHSEELDVSFPNDKIQDFQLYYHTGRFHVETQRSFQGKLYYIIGRMQESEQPYLACTVETTSDNVNRLCKSIAHTESYQKANGGSSRDYILQ